MAHEQKNQRGAAAIFIVVFFAILISIIALSFLRIAVQDQQQATNNDLSQSAFDSANAGLEDAKRALSWYNDHCPLNIAPAPADAQKCSVYNTAFNTPNNTCNIADIISGAGTTLTNTRVEPGSSEVKVSTNTSASSNDDKLDQAYTCVTIKTQTPNYQGTATDGKNDTLIPLRTVGNLPIDTIELKWFYFKSADSSATLTPTYPNSATKELPVSGTVWNTTTPPIMRFQLIPVTRGSINISDVNKDSRTAFLYPSTTVATDTIDLNTADPGRTPTTREKSLAPNLAKCQPTINSGEFACNVKILPAVSTSPPANTDYYLRITSIYNNSDYEIKLYGDGGTSLRLFNNVAPQIDSTGRANDVFRRIQSRVRSITSSNPLTDGGFDITGGLCKDFNIPVYTENCTPDTLVNP